MKQYKPVLAFLLFAVLLFSACNDSLEIEKNPDISHVWLVGDAALGWSDSDNKPLVRPMLRAGSDTFEYYGNLTAGFLKINCDEIPDWDGRWYLPAKDTILNTNSKQKILFSPGGDGGETGFKWEINNSGSYHIILDKKNSTIECLKRGEFEPEMIGDVFNKMWLVVSGSLFPENKPESRPMTRNSDGSWSITTLLRSGWYIKFNGEDIPRTLWESAANPYRSSKWFCPPVDSQTTVGKDKLFRYGGDNALAWKVSITGSASGNVTITLKPKEGKIDFE